MSHLKEEQTVLYFGSTICIKSRICVPEAALYPGSFFLIIGFRINDIIPDKDHHVSNFEELRIVDNFYQTSAYYPKPVVGVTTVNKDGFTKIGPYSLCFPYYVACKDYYAMLLETRNNSNTAVNILTNGRCVLNFINGERKYMKNCVELGFPGDTPEEKMASSVFNIIENPAETELGGGWPGLIEQSFLSFVCSWVSELENAERFTD